MSGVGIGSILSHETAGPVCPVLLVRKGSESVGCTLWRSTRAYPAIPTTVGTLYVVAARDPRKGDPKLKSPPSEATR
jgi:hypothetical protein